MTAEEDAMVIDATDDNDRSCGLEFGAENMRLDEDVVSELSSAQSLVDDLGNDGESQLHHVGDEDYNYTTDFNQDHDDADELAAEDEDSSIDELAQDQPISSNSSPGSSTSNAMRISNGAETKLRSSGGYTIPSLQTMQAQYAALTSPSSREKFFKPYAHWSHSDRDLIHKLAMRGFEPILPSDIVQDFYSFPTALFTHDYSKAFISSCNRSSHSSSHNLMSRLLRPVMELATEMRGKLEKPNAWWPERWMVMRYRHFLRWTMQDAALHGKKGLLPLVVLVKGRRTTRATELQADVVQQLSELADQWRRSLHPKALQRHGIPPLYGLVCRQSILAIVSYVPEGTGLHDSNANHLRTIGVYDFYKGDHDVWNGFAAAIAIIHCRNKLIEIYDDGRVVDFDGTHEQRGDGKVSSSRPGDFDWIAVTKKAKMAKGYF